MRLFAKQCLVLTICFALIQCGCSKQQAENFRVSWFPRERAARQMYMVMLDLGGDGEWGAMRLAAEELLDEHGDSRFVQDHMAEILEHKETAIRLSRY